MKHTINTPVEISDAINQWKVTRNFGRTVEIDYDYNRNRTGIVTAISTWKKIQYITVELYAPNRGKITIPATDARPIDLDTECLCPGCHKLVPEMEVIYILNANTPEEYAICQYCAGNEPYATRLIEEYCKDI